MKSVSVNTSHPYEVLVGNGLLVQSGSLIAKRIAPCIAAVIADDTVDALFGDTLEMSLQKAGFQVCRIVFSHGEASKNMTTLAGVLEQLAENQITRTDLIVALGGGVTGDLAGFAAAVYLRGIRFVQVPTTFLAAIDSSVGGKTAVDLAAGKNLAGVFWQPKLVICDCEAIKMLPTPYFLDGMGEAVKYGMAFDKTLLPLLKGNVFARLPEIIAQCVALKAAIVAQDERDTEERRKLNFGHTLGHAIERCSNFSVTHGQAVAIGMVIITRACVKRGKVSPETLETLLDTLVVCGLPTVCDYGVDALAKAALVDKKRSGDRIALILPKAVGECTIEEIAIGALKTWIKQGL
ncbi:MAG: 3-dehydroquinate synthase [Candidatus Fimivivens sp.]